MFPMFIESRGYFPRLITVSDHGDGTVLTCLAWKKLKTNGKMTTKQVVKTGRDGTVGV